MFLVRINYVEDGTADGQLSITFADMKRMLQYVFFTERCSVILFIYLRRHIILFGQARSQDFQRAGVLFGGKVNLKPKRGSRLGKMWTFVLYPGAFGPRVFGPPAFFYTTGHIPLGRHDQEDKLIQY